jgi:hypothetical protein
MKSIKKIVSEKVQYLFWAWIVFWLQVMSLLMFLTYFAWSKSIFIETPRYIC